MTELSFPLDEQRIEELQRLAALGYSPEDMALYFDVDKIYFLQAAFDVNSKVYYYIERGKFLARAKEEMALLEAAEKGEVKESEQLNKIRRDRGWQLSKLDIFGGFKDKKIIQRIQDHIQNGSTNDLSTEESIWLDALTLAHSLYRKYGRRNTVEFFIKTYQLKHRNASEIVDEALSLFYVDRGVEKKALRHLFAEEILEGSLVVRDNAVSARDWEVYTNMKMAAAKLLELDKEDPEKADPSQYLKPIRVYALQTEHLGLPDINRQDVARQIESLPIPERDKVRLRQEALLENINLEDRLNDLEEKYQAK
jgi:hypothetical protein